VGWYEVNPSVTGSVVSGSLASFSAQGTSVATLPTPSNASLTAGSLSLDSVSCPTSSTCYAAGTSGTTFYLSSPTAEPATTAPVVVSETSSGSWSSPKTLPLPSNAASSGSSTLSAIACPTSSTCFAVGSYEDSSGARQGLIESYSSSAWSASELTLPADTFSNPAVVLDAISCTSSTSCIAVGSYDGETPMIVQVSGGTFGAAQPLALPANASSSDPSPQLTGVACWSGTSCMAVGNYITSTNQQASMTYAYNSGTWSPPSVITLPGADSSASAQLTSIACTSTGSCYAVGDLSKTSGNTVPASVSESSGSWSVLEPMATPNTTNTSYVYGSLNSVSCAGSISACVAVGVYDNSAGFQVPMAISLGTSPQAIATSLPTNARPSNSANLESISCATSTSNPCIAVGSTPTVVNQIAGITVGVSPPVVTVPGAPIDVAAVAKNGAAEISWSAPTSDGGSPITSYEVFDATSASSISTTSSYACVTTAGTCTIRGLTNGTTYYFEAVAFNEAGEGGASQAVSATPVSTTSSTSPTITSITPASGLLSGGSKITITGTNFTGATAVDFGTTAATSFTVVSNTEITAVVPSTSTPGLTKVTVTTPEGVSSTSSPTPGYLYLTSSVYTPVTPYRICDTRANNPSGLSGTDLTQCEGKTLGPNSSLTIQVAGTNPSGTTSGGVPDTASAAVLNVTVTNTTATSYLTAYPTGVTQPLSSNLNWVANETTPNLIEVPIGANGDVTLYNYAGSADVIVDIEGYVTPAPSTITTSTPGLFVPVTPYRICDTRTNNPSGLSGTDLTQCEGKTLGPNSSLTIQAAGTNPSGTTSGGVPANASAVVLNVTATNTTATSYLTAYPTGVTQPLSSNLNWVANETVPNRVIIPVNASTGDITLYNFAGSADVIVDVAGYYTSTATASTTGSTFTPVSPYRICDTRANNPSGLSGLDLTQCEGKTLGPNSSLTIQATGTNPSGASSGGVPTGASAVVLNATVTNTTATSYLTAYPASLSSPPIVSDLNWTQGDTVPNLIVVNVSSSGKVAFYNSLGSTDLIVDVLGYYG